MKKRLISYHQIINLVFLFSLLVPVSLIAQSSGSDVTTIILVRHAEKVDDSSDPDLSEAGYNRAEKLAEMFDRVQFNAIYSTNFNRTRETVKPIAESNGLSIQSYEPQNPPSQVEKWMEAHKDETILVSGHSNSTPAFANAILQQDHFEGNFEESDYGNILIITITGEEERKLLHLRY